MAQLHWLEDFSTPQAFSQSNWSGDTAFFSLDSASFLLLQGPPRSCAASIRRLNAIRHQAQWEIDLTLDLNPSASNYTKIYLWAYEKDPQSIQNVVFLKIGGQTEDRIELWSMRQGLSQLIVESQADLVDKNRVELRMRVIADSLQGYDLWADTSEYFPKGSITLSSDCISPNFDGHQDNMQILIRSPFSKVVAELKVLDEIGIPVRHLLQHELIGAKHAFSWNGTNGSGERLRVGLYFFWLQLRSEGGQTNITHEGFSVCQ
jgi:hypothetical protein